MEKTKVLAVSSSGLVQKEGISTVILDYFSRFDREKFDLSIVAQGEYSAALAGEFEAAGVRVVPMPSRKRGLPRYIRALIKLFREKRYDVVYVHGSSAILAIELVTAWMCGVKRRIVHSHNTTCSHKKADRLLRPVFYGAYTDALACGRDAGQWLYGGRSFTVISNGRSVATYRFDPEVRKAVRAELGVDDETLLVGHVGNFNEQKNQQFILEIAKCLKNQKVQFCLIGDGDTRARLQKEAEGLNVRFTGSIPTVPRYLQAMDVMLLPSLHEGLPLVAIEWQIAALPCILSDRVTGECAYSELVHFLPLERPEDWAELLLKIAKTDREAAAAKMPAQTAAAGFDIDQNVLKLQEILKKG